MGESCSTQRSALSKRPAISCGPCVVHVQRAGDQQEGRLNDGRRFQDEYEVGTRLAPKVHVVRNRVTEATYVSYTLRRSDLPCTDDKKLLCLIKRLQCLDHPNICRLLEAFEDLKKDVVHLVYEKAIGMPLLKYVDQQSFSEEKAASLVQQVTRALKYGDEHDVCHGALVPKNLFVSSTGKVSITDFGLAFLLKPSPLEGVLEHEKEGVREDHFSFLPPEALEPWLETAIAHKDAWGRQKHIVSMSTPVEGSKAWKKEHARKDFWSSSADVWSLGVILFKVLRGHMPFTSRKGALGLANNIVNQKLEINLEFQGRSHGMLSEAGIELLQAMLHKSPASRPSSEELLHHAWICQHTRATAAPLKREVCKELSTFVEETHLKKLVMRMLVTKLPPRKIAALHEAFESMDGNHDGQLTLLELKRGLARFPELCEGLATPVADVFAAIDIDSGGKVSLHEFLAATLDAHGVVTDSVIRESFRCLDTNGDGMLSKEELAVAVREIDGQLGPAHVEHLAGLLEEELGSRPLDVKEFVGLIKEEGQRVSRHEAVAKEAAAQGWACCCTVQAPERLVVERSARDCPGSPGYSPMAFDSRRESRSPKQSPKASQSPGPGHSGRYSGRRRSSKSPTHSGRTSGKADLRRGRQNEDYCPRRQRSGSPASSNCSTECP